MLTSQEIDRRRDLTEAMCEVEQVVSSSQNAANELFDRYLSKSTEKKEAFVLALIGQALVTCRRHGLTNRTVLDLKK